MIQWKTITGKFLILIMFFSLKKKDFVALVGFIYSGRDRKVGKTCSEGSETGSQTCNSCRKTVASVHGSPKLASYPGALIFPV